MLAVSGVSSFSKWLSSSIIYVKKWPGALRPGPSGVVLDQVRRTQLGHDLAPDQQKGIGAVALHQLVCDSPIVAGQVGGIRLSRPDDPARGVTLLTGAHGLDHLPGENV